MAPAFHARRHARVGRTDGTLRCRPAGRGDRRVRDSGRTAAAARPNGDFIEQLNTQFLDLQHEFRERVRSSPPFAILTEETTLAAVRTSNDERRRDLAAVLRNGFEHDDSRVEEDLALARQLEGLNEPQLLLLMSHGNFKRTLGDTELGDFHRKHPGVFEVAPPLPQSSPDERRRWAMYNHYVGELVIRGLLEDEDGVAKSGGRRKVKITELGRLLLQLVDRGPKSDDSRARRAGG